jgi:hypothetical protein
MTQSEKTKHLKSLHGKLKECRALVHGELITAEEVVAVEESIPRDEPIDAGGAHVVEETQIP